MHVVGSKEAIDEVEVIIGNSEKKLMEPDFLSLFGGLLIGVILGSVPIMIPTLPVPIKLGFAAGPLLAALLISRYGGIGVIHSYINNGAIFFMKDLGICLFFAAVGVFAQFAITTQRQRFLRRYVPNQGGTPLRSARSHAAR